MNSSKLIVLRPGTIWLHFTQLKNFLTEMTPVWNFTESELNKCLCHSPLYKSELLLNLFLLFLRYLLACFVVVVAAEYQILVTFAIFANFVGFQMTFFTLRFKGTVTRFWACAATWFLSGEQFFRLAFGEEILFHRPWDARESHNISIQELFGPFGKF